MEFDDSDPDNVEENGDKHSHSSESSSERQTENNDGDAENEENTGEKNQEDPSRVVLDFVRKFCDRSEADIQNHLLELGIVSLSDLGVLDLNESFKGLLKAVQIGKLKAEYDRITSGNNKDQTEIQGDVDLIDFNNVFTSVQKRLLLGKRRLSKSDRLSISRTVGDDLYSSLQSVNQNICTKVAQSLELKFKDALSSKTETTGKSEKGLAYQIYDHIKYKQRLDRKKRKTPSTSVSCLRNFSRGENAGINQERDLPTSFPDGETRESQEAKRIKIMTDGPSGALNGKAISKLMRETYVLQRYAIHSKKTFAEVLVDWPYFGRFGIFKNHFYELMDIDGEAVGQKMNKICPKFIKFFEAEANKRRKGQADVVCENLRQILAEFSKFPKTSELEFVTVILCVAAKLNQDISHLFMHFEETTSYDEIQASRKLPKDGRPIIAVLGDNIMNNPECFVLVDNTIISTTKLNPLKAILCVFMSYFNMKIMYPQKIAILLEFIQRSIFEITGDPKCSRTERKKTAKGVWESAPKAVSPRYLSLIRDFDDFNAIWEK